MRYADRDRMRRMILKGLRDGLPIGLGYFAVAFSLGINARGAGISPLQGWVASILNHASAGEYALYALIGARAAAWEIAAVIFVTNMRYLLMSAALSQKMAPETGFLRRLGTGFSITDEIHDVVSPSGINATISKTIGAANLSLYVSDLLGQSRNLRVTDSNNRHVESLSKTLGRYIILSFSYNFGSMGRGAGRGRMGGGMPGGRGGRGGRGGGMPMGGPMMGGGRPMM